MAEGDVVIRLRDVYEIARSVETKVDLLALSAANVEKSITDHETRLRTVERRVLSLPSLATLVAIGALVVSIIAVARGEGSVTTPRESSPPAATVPKSPSTSSVPTTTSVVVLHPSASASTGTDSSSVSTPSSSPTSVPSSTPTTPVTLPVPVPVSVPPVTVPRVRPLTTVEQLLARIESLNLLSR